MPLRKYRPFGLMPVSTGTTGDKFVPDLSRTRQIRNRGCIDLKGFLPSILFNNLNIKTSAN